MGLLLVTQFMVEGLWKTAFLPALALLGVLCLTPILLFANRMPEAVQRSLSFLPLEIDPEVRAAALNSSQWRFEMWREVWPEVPRYLWLGKGYSIDPVDLYLTEEATRSGILTSYEGAVLAGDYHNGPLSVLVPFGLWGTLAFAWVLGAGVKVLYSNYRYGDARLRQVNITLFALFLAQILHFLFVFGAISSQLAVFLGTLGLSVSLNAGGVCRRPAVARQTALAIPLAAPAAVA
jgi:O-antigen ligase/polysaccharide polymerase Wzy-like membrane protein